MIAYIASPIDDVTSEQGERITSLRREARAELERHALAWYDPSLPCGGYGNAPQAIYAINEFALETADGVIAIWPEGVPSVGVPMEIQTAHNLGKPVVVVGRPNSLQLQGMGIVSFDNVKQAVSRLFALVATAKLAEKPIPRAPIIKWTGDSDFEPTRSYDGDAGYDLYVAKDTRVHVGKFVDVDCGISVELPPGTWALVTGRSSTIRNRGILVVQGVIDNGYRGPIFAACQSLNDEVVELKRGERVAQLIPFPLVAEGLLTEQVAELSRSERGVSAFGSTGL